MGKIADFFSRASSKPKRLSESDEDTDGFIIFFCLILTAVLCLMATSVFNKTQKFGGVAFPISGFLFLGCFTVYLAVNRKLNSRNIILLILAAGFLLRLNYVAYTTLTPQNFVRQHDLRKFGGDSGHSAYIEYFYYNGFSLPDFDPTTKVQFYHPPLHHFLAACWMRFLTFFGMSYNRAVGSIQFLTLFYSSCCILVSERILSKLNMKGLGKIIALSVVAFHPTFIILAGSINNDILSILFILLSLYTTINWYKKPDVKNILWIALSVGLGMSTKLSVALVAPPIAAVFLIKFIMFIKGRNKKEILGCVGQFCSFGVVCVPLGLWYAVRNYVKYHVPFNYVLRLPDDSPQYIGFRSVYERLFDFSYHPFENIFLSHPTVSPEGLKYYEYNPFVALVKTSMFGEYNYSKIEGIMPLCKILFVLNIIMILLSVVSMIYCVVRKSSFLDKTLKLFLVSYHLLIFVNFIIFAFQYPHTCSMDFRYIVPTLVTGGLFIGMSVSQFEQDFSGKPIAVKAVKYSVLTLTVLFCIFSAGVYIILGK